MNRREMLKLSGSALAARTPALAGGQPRMATPSTGVERWGIFELPLDGPATGNAFLDVSLAATFRKGNRAIHVDGFYDGEGKYLIRFMPDEPGPWSYTTEGSLPALHNHSGAFTCTPAAANNHGPVSIRDSFHFGYADGTPYYPFGTTCYAWVHQTEELQQQTLRTLAASPFNKLRMCIFPKWYQYNRAEPPLYPFPRTGDTNDYTRFNPAFFRHIEQRLSDLRALNIEADLILFHPYDKWGYQEMPPEVDDRYLRYVIARFGAYRNVWWSLANEFDLMRHKTNADWDRFARIVTEADPYAHLRSIHYSHQQYDYTRAWCTHAGIQDYAFDKAAEWRATWRKPVIFDECMYEGNINSRWGNLSGEEMNRRFWLAVVAGCYGGHGETYITPDLIENDAARLWWSHGGTLHGSSPQRIAFLRKLLEESASEGGGRIGFTQLEPAYYPSAARSQNEALLWYFDFHQPSYYDFPLPADIIFRADWIDPWGMTTKPVEGTFRGKSRIQLPGHPYAAIRFRKVPS